MFYHTLYIYPVLNILLQNAYFYSDLDMVSFETRTTLFHLTYLIEFILNDLIFFVEKNAKKAQTIIM